MFNKIIIEGGLTSKNSPIYTEESFLLAFKNRSVHGIKINVFSTKDNILVPICKKTCKMIGINEEYIKTHTYNQLSKINLGTKVKTNNIITLDRLLNLINNELIIILDISSIEDLDLIEKLIYKHPNKNYYIVSENHVILNKLIKYENINTGIYINDETDFNYAYDFIIVNDKYIRHKNILEKINKNETIFHNTKKDNIKYPSNYNYII